MNNCENWFIKYPDSPDWWRWPQNGEMKVYNYLGGWHEINENSEQWINARVIHTVDTWHQLYLLTGYCPLTSLDRIDRDMWIAPDGRTFNCDDMGHELAAEYILDVLYDEEPWDAAGDVLIGRGWVKVTTNTVMFESYATCGFYTNMTMPQWREFIKWDEYFKMGAKNYGIF